MDVLDDKWHHLCTAWNSDGGAWKISIDGSVRGHGTGYKSGESIPRTGSLVVGQDQDLYAGVSRYPTPILASYIT